MNKEIIKPGVNAAAGLKSLKHLFKGSYSNLGELIQNARRAGSTFIKFTLEQDGNVQNLTVEDDGHGIKDFQALVQLWESAWSPETAKETPFGMGVFSLFYACERVVFRSHGKRLVVGLDDIVNMRELVVEPDTGQPNETHRTGARIEMLGLHEQSHDQLSARLKTAARGCPIAVFLNDEELERTHAQAALNGQETDIGFVHLRGIHFGTYAFGFHPRLYIQGLPLGYGCDADGIVHLNESFTAVMPDRQSLYDDGAQQNRISRELMKLAVQFLHAQKAELDDCEFVNRYWKACIDLNCDDLLAVSDWLPVGAIKSVKYVGYSDSDCYVSISSPIQRKDIVAGKYTVWTNTPESSSDNPHSAALLGIMKQDGILAANDIPEGHWLNGFAVDVEGARVLHKAHNPKIGRCVQFNCVASLVDRLDLQVVNSKGDEVHATELTEGFIIVSDDQTEDGLNEYLKEVEMTCYLKRDGNVMNVSYVLDDYRDESDVYRREHEEDMQTQWEDAICELLGEENLATLIQKTIDRSGIQPAPTNDLAVAGIANGRYPQTLLLDDAFWEKLGSGESLAVDIGAVRAAFESTVKECLEAN